MIYDIECKGIARELYSIEADSEEDALDILNTEGPLPYMTEVSEIEIISIKEDE